MCRHDHFRTRHRTRRVRMAPAPLRNRPHRRRSVVAPTVSGNCQRPKHLDGLHPLFPEAASVRTLALWSKSGQGRNVCTERGYPARVGITLSAAVRRRQAASSATIEIAPQKIGNSHQLIFGIDNTDITSLILADHNWFREQFARLDDLQARRSVKVAALESTWRPLADELDVHAYIDETIFCRQLFKGGPTIPNAKHSDAIGDHNEIRDAVKAANAAAVGSDAWWTAVGRAREANDDHMVVRLAAPCAHRTPRGTRSGVQRVHGRTPHDRDWTSLTAIRRPTSITCKVERPQRPKNTSLGIGSLKGQ